MGFLTQVTVLQDTKIPWLQRFHRTAHISYFSASQISNFLIYSLYLYIIQGQTLKTCPACLYLTVKY